MFAAFEFDWPPGLMAIFNAFSLASFNLEMLAPECSFSVNYEAKWLVTQLLPLILLGAVGWVLLSTRLVQWLQRTVFHVLPFGALAELNMIDVCIGVTISGSYYLYFRTCTSAAVLWKLALSSCCRADRVPDGCCVTSSCWQLWFGRP